MQPQCLAAGQEKTFNSDLQNEHLFNCCADQSVLSLKRIQDCSHFHINSFNSVVQNFKCEIVVPLVKSFPVCPPYHISYKLRRGQLIAPLCPGPHFTHLLNFEPSTHSFPAILSCCLGEVSQGTHKDTSLSSVSCPVKMFFRYPQKILTAGKLPDHDLSYCQIFCWILVCHSPVFSYFISSLNWNECLLLVPYFYIVLTKSCLKSKIYEDCDNTT